MNYWILPTLFGQQTGSGDAPALSENLQQAGDDLTTLAQVDSWAELLALVKRLLTEHGTTLAMNVLAALAIFVLGRWLAKWLTRLVKRVCTRANVDETLVTFLGNLVYFALLLLVIMAALNRLGINTTSFAAILAAAGLAIGLALQGTLSNFAAGVMLILFKPFKVGDFVVAGGSTGAVEAIHIFNTVMRTGDNIVMVVPNSAITSGTITNYSAKETRRIDLSIGCGYGDDLKAVKAFLQELVDKDTRILKEPAAVVAVDALGDSSVNFVVRPWVNSSDYWAVRWELTESIKNGFDERGFNIPYPTRDIHIHREA